MAGYEDAIGNALKAVFPGVRITGCRFHYSQTILKKIKDIGLQAK